MPHNGQITFKFVFIKKPKLKPKSTHKFPFYSRSKLCLFDYMLVVPAQHLHKYVHTSMVTNSMILWCIAMNKPVDKHKNLNKNTFWWCIKTLKYHKPIEERYQKLVLSRTKQDLAGYDIPMIEFKREIVVLGNLINIKIGFLIKFLVKMPQNMAIIFTSTTTDLIFKRFGCND